MKYSIDKIKSMPAYVQLYDQIKSDIVSLTYPYGIKLPSKRLLAEETGVSVITVEHAYDLLCDEGYIESRERSGFFVIFRSDEGFANETYVHRPCGYERNELQGSCEFPFSVFSKTMRKIISEYGTEIMKKTENSGCIALRNEIRSYLWRNRGICVDIKQIIIGSGSEYLYRILVELLGKERLYAFETPCYEKIEKVYYSLGVRCDPLPLGKDGIESKYLLNTNADVLHITPYRSFPTGITASASKRYEYVRWASGKERYIIEDDFESEFSVSRKNEETVFSLSKNENCIYMNTFSKTVSSGIRLGYMVLPVHLAEKFEKEMGFYSCTVPTFEQLVMAEIIANGSFERHINRVRRQKRKNNK